MAIDRTPAILVKAAPLGAMVEQRLGLARVRLQAEPLFENIPPERGAFGAAGGGLTWQRLTLEAGDDRNPWDLAHALTAGGQSLGAAGQSAVFAEPDLLHQWQNPQAGVGDGLGAAATPEPQRTNFPRVPGDNLWFRDKNHSGFNLTADAAALGAGARIAHFDTGYDPAHATLPKHLLTARARNFVDRDRPTDATDRGEGGPMTNPGHGTGTLAILASQQYGGAPAAEIVPVRIANGVVLFSTSAFAKALDYVYGLRDDPAGRIDVITMSMGGVASRAWAEAVNRVYEAGVFIVTAAGNNFGNLPTRNIVFPARFQRVLAACGVMADGSPYADLGLDRMAGNYGPDSKMGTALSAPTPNVPWAVRGGKTLVNWSGQGTSCATPQIAAAAALWIAANRARLDAYPERWMRVEAVRRALFDSAAPGGLTKLGRGLLQADGALGQAPAAAAQLKASASANAEFPILRLLTGLGAAAPSARRMAMFELEALQLSQSAAIEALLPDPDQPPESLTAAQRRKIYQALADQPGASDQLKRFLAPAAKPAGPVTPSGGKAAATAGTTEAIHLKLAREPLVRQPAHRRLRVYAFDPSLSASQDTAAINIARLDVPWEDELQPGPVGEYLEVVDVDPASAAAYAPVDLNHPYLLSQDGLSPNPADPRFHQQMVYAVAMTTIGHFERALGRTAMWSPRMDSGHVGDFVPKLRIHPHAFRGANAYYSPSLKALLFGYFPAGSEWRDTPEGQITFSCLSHDIVAHETTHALLDGLHPRYRESTHPDAMALHEAFADLVALFQHFTLTDAVEHEIAKARGDLDGGAPLLQLALEFGKASSREGEFQRALRKAVDGWTNEKFAELQGAAPALPDEAHDRGAMLVAAVFDAFLTLYRARQEDLVLLATGGTGVLPEGRLPQPLVKALAAEASKVASQLMGICIRALDYCPPVDCTFGDYLRAMITADRDVVPDDPRGYRLALIAGFSKRGIFPQNVPHLSPGSMVWEAPPIPIDTVAKLLPSMDLGWNRSSERRKAWTTARDNARTLHAWLTTGAGPDGKFRATDAELRALGLYREAGKHTVEYVENGETFKDTVEVRGIEVHSVRPARRAGPDGLTRSDLVVEITQSWKGSDGVKRRGGCTVLFDLETFNARYLIRKRVANVDAAREEAAATWRDASLRAAYFGAAGDDREPFAMLHGCH